MADEDTLKKLKQLSPRERIKKLKEIQEKSKKEIDDAQKLIRESEEQDKIEEELKKVPIPEVRSVSIDELFGEARAIFKEARFVGEKAKAKKEEKETKSKESGGIEESVGISRQQIAEEETRNHRQYQVELSYKPVEQLKQKIEYMQSSINPEIGPTDYQRRMLYDLGKGLEKKEEDIKKGRYTPSQMAEVIGEISEIRQKQKDLYRR